MNYFYNSITSVWFDEKIEVRPFKVFKDEHGKKFFLLSDLMINMGYSEKDIFQTCKYWIPRFIVAGILFTPLTSDTLNYGSQVFNFGDHEGLIPVKLLGGLKHPILGFMTCVDNQRYKPEDMMTLAEFCLANYGEADESDKIPLYQIKDESKPFVVANQVDIGTAILELASAIRELSMAIVIANEEVS
jgi:hypothetical protein